MDKLSGISFSPLNRSDKTARPAGGSPGPGAAASTPIQQAIKVLSLRMPRVVGAAATTSPALLNAVGGAGGGFTYPRPRPVGGMSAEGPRVMAPTAGAAASPQAPSLGLEDLLRKLFGFGAAIPGAASGLSAPMTPTPSGLAGPTTLNPSAPPPRIQVGLEVPGMQGPLVIPRDFFPKDGTIGSASEPTLSYPWSDRKDPGGGLTDVWQ